ncbi:MAG TPA: beta galactosidase jelly roll domain-containing protein, partial [Niastella sp.]|nr:beta galactosidase jelly roll domain-containing protein [Niastella sp.]
MLRTLFLALFCIGFVIHTFAQTVSFDADWRFHRGGAQRAEMPGFDDSKWRTVDLPHDWSIEDLPGTQTPFDSNAIGQVSTGFTTGGTGWYRKTFAVPAAQKGKRIHIQFDGVYMNADVWINGVSVGNHPYGYTSFSFDVTDKIKFGESNTISVQVKNEGQNSRWYTGSGIYRHVWLKTLDPVHVAQWGTYITTPEVSASAAKVNIRTHVKNETANSAELRLVTRLINAKGTEVAKTESKQPVNANDSFEFKQEAAVTSPQLWSLQTPALYIAITEVYRDGTLTDKTETKFGIRTISFDVAKGFMLNGKPMKLQGGCVHHDN